MNEDKMTEFIKNYSDESIKDRKIELICEKTGSCPYEYDKDSDRDVEGMPFIEDDPRNCPVYGHICPEFMEDFGFTVEDLNIRAIIHCGGLIDYIADEGRIDKESELFIQVKEEYNKTIEKYPAEEYPYYYM
ncbi:MAG: hypothetical protein LWY06_13080 [Firmicutes bacterium]|nr:hypothetical protein [Bacillota bacterium]